MKIVAAALLAAASAGATRVAPVRLGAAVVPRPFASRARVRASASDDASGLTAAGGGGGGGGGGVPAWLPSFIVPALGGALFGYDIGAVSAVARILGAPDVATASFGAPLSEIALGNVASLPLFGGMLASLAIVFIGDAKIGRLTELKLASLAYFAGTLGAVCAPSLPFLLAGRLGSGLGIGLALHAAPLYIAETAPPELRGRLIAYKEAAIVSGIVLGYIAGALTGDAGLWRQTFAPAFVLEAAMLAQAVALPESPRWLALRGRTDEAELAVAQLRGCSADAARAEVAALAPASRAKPAPLSSAGETVTASVPEPSVLDVFPRLVSEQVYRDALVIGCGLVLFQQLSGQPSVLYYANTLFESIGLGYIAAVAVGGFKLVMTVVSANLVESPQWGRRPLLLAGTGAMTVSLLGLAAMYAVAGPALAAGGSDAAAAQAGVIGLLFLYVGGYQIGFGPITWLVLSEIFPIAVRSPAMSVGTLLNFGSNYLVGTLFELERRSVGEPALFGGFAAVALVAVAFIFTKVPETRGLSLEEIEEKLRGGGPL